MTHIVHDSCRSGLVISTLWLFGWLADSYRGLWHIQCVWNHMCGSHSDLYIVRDSNSSWFIQRVVTLTVRWDSNMWVPNYMSHGLYESRTIWDMKYMRHEQYESRTICVTYCMTYYKTWGLCCDMCPTYTSHGLYESQTIWDMNYMSHELNISQIVRRLQDLGSVLWHIRVPTYMSHRLYGHELYESRTIWDVAYMSHELYVSQII